MTPCQQNRVNEAVRHGGISQSNLFGLQQEDVSIFWQVIFFVTAVLYVQSVLLNLLDQTVNTAVRVTFFVPFGNNFSHKKTSSRKNRFCILQPFYGVFLTAHSSLFPHPPGPSEPWI